MINCFSVGIYMGLIEITVGCILCLSTPTQEPNVFGKKDIGNVKNKEEIVSVVQKTYTIEQVAECEVATIIANAQGGQSTVTECLELNFKGSEK